MNHLLSQALTQAQHRLWNQHASPLRSRGRNPQNSPAFNHPSNLPWSPLLSHLFNLRCNHLLNQACNHCRNQHVSPLSSRRRNPLRVPHHNLHNQVCNPLFSQISNLPCNHLLNQAPNHFCYQRVSHLSSHRSNLTACGPLRSRFSNLQTSPPHSRLRSPR